MDAKTHVCVGGPQHGRRVACQTMGAELATMPGPDETGIGYDRYVWEPINAVWGALRLRGEALRWEKMTTEDYRREALRLMVDELTRDRNARP